MILSHNRHLCSSELNELTATQIIMAKSQNAGPKKEVEKE